LAGGVLSTRTTWSGFSFFGATEPGLTSMVSGTQSTASSTPPASPARRQSLPTVVGRSVTV
jgi:hypothetical protein